MKKTKKVGFWILIILSAILLIVFVKFLMTLVLIGIDSMEKPIEQTTTDVEEYLQVIREIKGDEHDVHSGLFVFPRSADNISNIEHRFYHKTGLFDDTYLIYLEAHYIDEEALRKEKERLAGISCTIKTLQGEVTNYVEYSEDDFEYPAYITIKNAGACYEYALIDEKNKRIIFVFAQISNGEGIVPKEYMPMGMQDEEGFRYDHSWPWVGKNIYYAPEEVEGEIDAYTYYLD